MGLGFWIGYWYEPLSKLPVSALITPTVVPYMIPYITPLRGLDSSSYKYYPTVAGGQHPRFGAVVWSF